MKQLFLFAGLMTVIIACSTSKPINFDQLQDRNGLFYMANQKEPFTGAVASYKAGHLVLEGQVRNGLRDGLWVFYYPTGQKQTEGAFADGLRDGTWTSWKENGEQILVEQYKMGTRLGNETPADSSEVASPAEPPATATRPAAPKKESRNTEPQQVQVQAPAQVQEKPAEPVKQKEPDKPQPVDWERLRGGSVKTLDGIPYTGPVIKYFNSGKVELEGAYTYGRRSGKWTFYWPTGNVKDVKWY